MYGSVNCSFDQHPQWLPPLADRAQPQHHTLYVWQASANALMRFYDNLSSPLNAAERAAAQRYYHLADRQRYVLQHGLLRLLLGWYLQLPAADIAFSFNATKKPYLANSGQPCFFNISHSAGALLIAIGDSEMGADIEHINPGFDYHDIASQYFSPAEVAFIHASPLPINAFFLLWTRKEALLKACGTGIDDNLPDMPALNGLHQLPAGYYPTHWQTYSFNAHNSSIASLTYAQPQPQIALRHADAGLVQWLLSSAKQG